LYQLQFDWPSALSSGNGIAAINRLHASLHLQELKKHYLYLLRLSCVERQERMVAKTQNKIVPARSILLDAQARRIIPMQKIVG
jgi:hypothetical protein